MNHFFNTGRNRGQREIASMINARGLVLLQNMNQRQEAEYDKKIDGLAANIPKSSKTYRLVHDGGTWDEIYFAARDEGFTELSLVAKKAADSWTGDYTK